MSLSHGRSFCLTNFFLRPSDRRLLVQRCCISFFRSFLSINWIMRTKSLFRRKEGYRSRAGQAGTHTLSALLYSILETLLFRPNKRPTDMSIILFLCFNIEAERWEEKDVFGKKGVLSPFSRNKKDSFSCCTKNPF